MVQKNKCQNIRIDSFFLFQSFIKKFHYSYLINQYIFYPNIYVHSKYLVISFLIILSPYREHVYN